MAPDEEVLLIIRGQIASLSQTQRAQVESTADRLRYVLAQDKELGHLALALIGAEMAAQP